MLSYKRPNRQEQCGYGISNFANVARLKQVGSEKWLGRERLESGLKIFKTSQEFLSVRSMYKGQ